MTKNLLLSFVSLSVAIVVAYSNSLTGTWAMDDVVIGKGVSLADIRDIIGFRKVSYLTFAFNQMVAPFSPLHYRLLNIFIHILNTVLVYSIAYRSIMLYSAHDMQKIAQPTQKKLTKRDDSAFYGAFLSGVLFALHPININAVAYIVQRMASLATFFVLVALLVYSVATQTSRKWQAIFLYIGSGMLILVGVFAKENAVMAVPLILLYDYVFLSHFEWNVFRKRLIIICGLGILSIGSAFFLLNMQNALADVMRFFFTPNEPLTEKGWMARDVYWTPLQHILTEFRVVSRYLFVIIFPLPRLFVFDWWSFPLSHGITQPMTTLFSVVLIASLLAFSVYKIKRFPFLCFGVLWYFCAVSLESFLAIGSDLYFEHRNYLPVAGLFIGIASQSVIFLAQRKKINVVFPVIILLGISLGAATFARNTVWKDSLTLWNDTISKAPSNLRALMALGNAHLVLSDFRGAEDYYRTVIKISAKDQRLSFLDDAAYSLGMLYLASGHTDKAAEVIRKYEMSLESYRLGILKGLYKASVQDFDGALAEYEKVLRLSTPRDFVILNTLIGDAYRKQGLFDAAVRYYERAILEDPGFAAAYYGMGAAFLSKHDVIRASEYFRKTLAIDPHNVSALADMAEALLISRGNLNDAFSYADRAVSKSPPFFQPYLTMGTILIMQGREKEADAFYRRALELRAPEYLVPFSKARAYFLKGDTEKAYRYVSEVREFKDLPGQIRRMIEQHP